MNANRHSRKTTPTREEQTQTRYAWDSELYAVGSWDAGEFAQLRLDLDPLSRWKTAASLSALLDHADNDDIPPAVVLVAQVRPGTDAQVHVDRLLKTWPLTRIVIVAGSWCEGELRTGRPLAGVVRLYWYELPAWWRAAATALARRAAPPWSAPLDDGRSEPVGAPSGGCPNRFPRVTSSRGIVAIDAGNYEVYETLAAVLAAERWESRWRPRRRYEAHSDHELRNEREQVVAGIWDGGQLDEDEQTRLSQFCDLLGGLVPVLALLDFPRTEHVALIRAAGAATLLAKPYQTSRLIAELSRITRNGNLAGTRSYLDVVDATEKATSENK